MAPRHVYRLVLIKFARLNLLSGERTNNGRPSSKPVICSPEKENVKVDSLLGHGGLFKTKGVGQQILADAVNAPVSVMATAGEGGAWGIALLASYLVNKEEGETLESFLDNKVFADQESSTLDPKPEGVAGFNAFMDSYMKGLSIERAAVESEIW